MPRLRNLALGTGVSSTLPLPSSISRHILGHPLPLSNTHFKISLNQPQWHGLLFPEVQERPLSLNKFCSRALSSDNARCALWMQRRGLIRGCDKSGTCPRTDARCDLENMHRDFPLLLHVSWILEERHLIGCKESRFSMGILCGGHFWSHST